MRFDLEWVAGRYESSVPVDLLTRCHLALRLKGHELFRHEDLLGEHQVKDAITVSAYPLAVWFAANWWRLRWEPSTSSSEPAVLQDWQMSHCLAAAGEGYAWPNLVFASDGENVQLHLTPTQESVGPLRYIERLDTWLPAQEYETGVSRFIESTLQQLGDNSTTDLHALWKTVLEERATPALALQRRIEAMLGYDPEEAPEQLMALLTGLTTTHGEGAIQELACLGGEKAGATITNAQQCLAHSDEHIKLPLKSVRKVTELVVGATPGYPWEKGSEAASLARKDLGIDKGPLNTRKLADLLETREKLFESNQNIQRLPIGLGEVTNSGAAKIVLGKARKDSRRFMTARLIADGIYAGETGNWLPCTDAATVRQKFQRSFAQEFLCPYHDLIDWMDTTAPDEETMEAAAEHFEVSPLLVNTVMVNHGHKHRSELEAFK